MSYILKKKVSTSLAGRAMQQIALSVALVIALMTAIAYYDVVSTVKEQSLGQLEKYIVDRTQHERTLFKLAEDNHLILKKELLQRLQALGDSDPVEAFNQKVVRFPDGTLRTRLEDFDGTRESFVFIGQHVNIDADLRRRVMTFLELSNQYGPAWHHRLQNIYFTTPENLLTGYWPEVPDWAHSLPADINMPAEEYVWAADKQHNPLRESVWTGLFYDIGSNTWMVSLETPVDIGERQIATIGHDITLNELIEHALGNHIEGAYNLIIRGDGRLIAHPKMMELIKAKQGNFNVNDSGNPQLKNIYQTIKNRKLGQKQLGQKQVDQQQTVLENSGFNEYLAIGDLKEPGWYFVTVYPESMVTGPAIDAARTVLLLGILSLMIELIIFYLVLHRGVSKPLREFSGAVSLVADGRLDMQLDVQRNDELGLLAQVFNNMVRSLQKRDDQTRFNTEMSSAVTRALSTYVTDHENVQSNFKQMLSDILLVTGSEYGFIGEIQHRGGAQFLKTHAISNIAWDDESRQLYKEYADQGMEFHNLDTLFGAAILSQSVVISNDPANDERSKGLSKGHPPLNSFLGIPLMIGNKIIGMVGVANRIQGYDQSLVDELNPLFQTCASVIEAFRKHKEFTIIKEATRKQATIIDQINVSVVSTDIQGYITSWNKGAERLFGYTRDEMLGKHIALMYTKEDFIFLKSETSGPLQKKGEHQMDVRMLRKSGEILYVYVSMSMFCDEQGKAMGMIGYSMDVSEQKTAEIELEQSHTRFATMFESISDAVISADPERKIQLVNSAAIKLFGYEKNEMIGNKTSMLYANTDDFEQQGKTRFNQNAKIISAPYTLTYRRKNGSEFQGETLGTAMKTKTGDILGYLGIIRDVSERSNIEGILKALASGSSGLKFESFIHEALKRLTEVYRCDFAFIGKLDPDGLHVQTLAVFGNGVFIDNFRYELKGTPCQDILDRKIELVKKDASIIYADDQMLADMGIESYFGAPLIASNGELLGIMSVMSTTPLELDEWTAPVLDVFATRVALELERNINMQELQQHRERLEELVQERTANMQNARDEAERANAAKSEFLSRMSHEFRTPLNAILGFGQLLESNPAEGLSENQSDNIMEIMQAGRHLLALVNEVLDLSRVESGMMDLNFESVAIAPIIRACISQLQPLADQRHIDIEFNFDKICELKADRTRLKQVLLNLLANAIKYNRESGQIRITCGPGSLQRLRVSVLDTGKGITQEQLPRLFQPFERFESAYEAIEGAGIGLAIVKNLIEVMHGEIGVESEPGRGSTFWFELPMSESTAATIPAIESAAVLSDSMPTTPADSSATDSTAIDSSREYKVLYVEDNPANLLLMQKIIGTRKDLGFLSAINAEAGLALANAQRPDLILLDINLPGMDGFEALRQLKGNKITQDIPVIAVTANAMNLDVERGNAAGFVAYVTKPIDIAALFITLDHHLSIGVKNDN